MILLWGLYDQKKCHIESNELLCCALGCLATSEAVQQSHSPELTDSKDSSESLPALAARAPQLCTQLCAGTPQPPARQVRHCPVPSSCHKQVIILTEHKCFYCLGGSEQGLDPCRSPWRSSHSQPQGFPFPLSLLHLQLSVRTTNGTPWKSLETSLSTARQLQGPKPLQYQPPFVNSAV